MAGTPEQSAAGCVFCRIIRGELPCAKLYEDDKVIAFLDINPVCPGHSLLVPKAHFATLMDLPPELGEPVLKVAGKLGRAVMEACKADGLNCVQNNFAAAGQMVFHVHWHLIPRFNRDGLMPWAPGKYESQARISEMAAGIISRL